MQDLLNNSFITTKQVYILGDFNTNLLNYDSHIPSTKFISLFLSQSFLPYSVHPTRVSDESATIIDNIFSNACNFDNISGDILIQISDHFPQVLIVKKAGIKARSMSFFQHDYATFNEENFVSDFNATSLEYLNDAALDVNDKFNRFLTSLNDLVSNHAPLKKLTKKDIKFRDKLWINNKIKKMIHIRDKVLNKLKKKSDDATKALRKNSEIVLPCY